jgi:Rap1a immunity proteins
MKILVLFLVLAASAQADTWLTDTKHPGDRPVWNTNTGWYDGNELYRWCTGADRSGCLGYVTGVASVEAALNAIPICFPAKATANQLRDVVIAYLRDNPADRHMSALVLVSNAYVASFPCRGGDSI